MKVNVLPFARKYSNRCAKVITSIKTIIGNVANQNEKCNRLHTKKVKQAQTDIKQ